MNIASPWNGLQLLPRSFVGFFSSVSATVVTCPPQCYNCHCFTASFFGCISSTFVFFALVLLPLSSDSLASVSTASSSAAIHLFLSMWLVKLLLSMPLQILRLFCLFNCWRSSTQLSSNYNFCWNVNNGITRTLSKYFHCENGYSMIYRFFRACLSS